MSEIKETLQEAEEQVVEAGVHNFSKEESWVKPEEPLLNERLEWFKDQKLGLMMHWGPYSQLGMVESWALSDEDGDWSRDHVDWTDDMEEFKREYFDLNKTFNPIRFQPDKWADLAADNGFKYLLFTTKHHDGFCMWDTHTTDYRITGTDTPFHRHRYADICRELFDAFRAKGLGISAYFSKADWHTPYYWAPGMERGRHMWRGPSYDPQKYPWLWEQFVQFTHEQIMELMTRYGRIECLWLDAGWVRDGGRVPQDIRLGEVVERARKHQPWLLVADRTVGGPYENIVTPEQTIPDRPMNIPWESCITVGHSFAFGYDDQYKSARQLAHILLEVVAKGGNLALNVGPQPDGRLPAGAIRSIKALGEWLKVHGEGIYGTRICDPYFTDGWAFTRKENVTYAFRLYKKDEDVQQQLVIPYTGGVKRIELVGTSDELAYERTAAGLVVTLPSAEVTEAAPITHTFRLFAE
ncbi:MULTISPECIES: alpha-L-fucosidase [Paenibacillus]|uniref:alpha-L-fucosidase n=1 Tax=Paenibacillus campinasensis TaxID=66347 RepID=A0A268EZ22_9BACL|nr:MULTISPECIES: alpha-L-fucosidase [Paenibacillus]MUG65086.1 alpha-L-fucosidase [Paenibacillus campinasensis]PAD78368.1 alpha-L-fucosidase [Paenibacillus campinasensis]PAK52343.1 alpha-L-fucosidase [Paenibacillus sp. 7541]